MVSNRKNCQNTIVISAGDPAGIGIEIILKALASSKLPKTMIPVIVGCKKSMEATYFNLKQKGVSNIIDPETILIEDIPLQGKLIMGKSNKNSGDASFYWVKYAAEYLLENKARALVTAPISKDAWHKAGHHFGGQTELLAKISNTKNASMLFTAVSPLNGWRLNTLLATTHIPLADVPKKLTAKLILSKLETLLSFCKRFKPNPKITVAGLNPHAGENGHIGNLENEILTPLLHKWQASHPEIQLEGPIPPDTCWLSASKAWEGEINQNCPDGILALYHDQGLIPVKLIAFDEAVNTTLDLPFIRTSPDHGTAFDIAGKGHAKSNSMQAALRSAWELTNL